MEIATSEYDGLFATTNYYLRITQPDGTYGYHDIKASPYPFTITQDEIDNTTKFALVFEVPAGGTILKTVLPTSKFVVTMSPNPFNKSFSLQLQSPMKDNVTVTIFDVLGKKLNSQTMSIEDLKNAIFGTGLASGIYQAIITQGVYKETIKIIKN